jgi:hypothetical protein
VAPDPIDRLYDLPPAEFTPARDALAKELKAGGDAEAAAAVKALRKPSAAAWAINRAARDVPDGLRALLDAGDALRAAQADLLAGTAERTDLRRAGETERAAVSAMVAAAAEAAEAAGHPLSAASATRVRETLHAAALDDGVRDALAAGRLEREAEAAGFASGLVAAAAPARRAAPKAAPGAPTDDRAAKRAAAKQVAERLKQARAAAREALTEANRAAREAERVAETAGKRLDVARVKAEAAQRELDEAQAREQAEATACEAAQRELRAAKGAAAAAQSALDELG